MHDDLKLFAIKMIVMIMFKIFMMIVAMMTTHLDLNGLWVRDYGTFCLLRLALLNKIQKVHFGPRAKLARVTPGIPHLHPTPHLPVLPRTHKPSRRRTHGVTRPVRVGCKRCDALGVPPQIHKPVRATGQGSTGGHEACRHHLPGLRVGTKARHF